MIKRFRDWLSFKCYQLGYLISLKTSIGEAEVLEELKQILIELDEVKALIKKDARTTRLKNDLH